MSPTEIWSGDVGLILIPFAPWSMKGFMLPVGAYVERVGFSTKIITLSFRTMMSPSSIKFEGA